VGVEAGDHGDSCRGVEVPGDDGVQVPDGELGVEGGGSGVLRIDRPDGSGDRYLAVTRQRGAHREGKGLGQGEVLQFHVEMVVDLGISFEGQLFYRGAAIFDGDKADGEIGYVGRLSGVLRAGLVAQAVPSSARNRWIWGASISKLRTIS